MKRNWRCLFVGFLLTSVVSLYTLFPLASAPRESASGEVGITFYDPAPGGGGSGGGGTGKPDTHNSKGEVISTADGESYFPIHESSLGPLPKTGGGYFPLFALVLIATACRWMAVFPTVRSQRYKTTLTPLHRSIRRTEKGPGLAYKHRTSRIHF